MTTAVPKNIAAGAACFLSAMLSMHAQQPSSTPVFVGDPTVRSTPAATSTTLTTTGGVNGYLPVFTGASTVEDSIVYQTPSGIGIGRTPNQDAWANAHRIPNEVEKAQKDKGHYLSPELLGHPEQLSVSQSNHPRLAPPASLSLQQ